MDDSEVSFVSFGTAILDEIRFPGQKPLTNILGGSGAYGELLAIFAMHTIEGLLNLYNSNFRSKAVSALSKESFFGLADSCWQ